MKKIFIDGGARIGESIEYFLDKREDLIGCDVYFFECNVDHINTLKEIQKNNKKYNFFVSDNAVWIEDGQKDFFISIDQWGDLGCTLDKDKSEKLDLYNPRVVNTIDISVFIKNLPDDSYIILKLDIEGSEYEVVEHLIKSNVIEKIKEVHIEWHDHFFVGKKDSYGLMKKLDSYNLIINNNWI
jgi:FkbM family methyltransferase